MNQSIGPHKIAMETGVELCLFNMFYWNILIIIGDLLDLKPKVTSYPLITLNVTKKYIHRSTGDTLTEVIVRTTTTDMSLSVWLIIIVGFNKGINGLFIGDYLAFISKNAMHNYFNLIRMGFDVALRGIRFRGIRFRTSCSVCNVFITGLCSSINPIIKCSPFATNVRKGPHIIKILITDHGLYGNNTRSQFCAYYIPESCLTIANYFYWGGALFFLFFSGKKQKQKKHDF